MMRNQFHRKAIIGLSLVLLTSLAMAQAPAPGGQAPGTPVSSAVANPTYTSIVLEININKPAADVWKRVGKYCDIGEWLQVPCTITSGKDGEVGTVRSIGNEILVGKNGTVLHVYAAGSGQPALHPVSRHG
jgi:hypothetical protein